MKPTLTSLSSGASEPAAHAALRMPGGTMAISAAPPNIPAPLFIKSLRLFLNSSFIASLPR